MDRQYWCAREKRRDFLKELYPHERDAHCHMDELTHTYFVLGGRYEYSVSAVWKVFFTDFDASAKAAEMISRAKTEKLRCLTASVYNLHAYLVFGKDLLPDSEAFWAEVARAAREGRELYEAGAPFGLPEVEAEMRSLLATKGSQRGRRSCYFLAACAGCRERELQGVWRRNGGLEAFKGTLMHKQAELYLQELAAWQLEEARSHVTMGELRELRPSVLARARAAAAPATALGAVAAVTEQELWDHPATQLYLSSFLAQECSVEFRQVEAWMLRQASLSPYRAEWSIYNEAAGVAGQVDSLWFDESRGEVVMVDWKRARHLLTSEAKAQAAQAFGAKGRALCPWAPAHPGPCASMFDCAYNHYKVQQHLYAHFLRQQYAVHVVRMLLVQCHPELGETELDYNEAEVEEEADLAGRALRAFGAGWRRYLGAQRTLTMSAEPS